MNKLKKKDYIYISIFIIFILGYVSYIYLSNRLFGSNVDYMNQHSIFPDYFRKLFYENSKIIPEFALNIGMGQNIFYMSYYGLFSPFIIVSYLLPFIPMNIYIPLISIASLIISIILFYLFIKDKYNSNIAFITSLLFLLNSTFIYHFHRHIMFVIYMPFIILSLKSVDLYLIKRKILPLVICTIMIIFSSYYFSIPGIITIGLYTIFRLLENNKFAYKTLFKIIYLVTIGILISSILLLPTIYALLNGRMPTLTNSITIKDLLSPFKNFEYTFYYSFYSWGITFIYIISLISAFISKKKNYIFLSIIFSLIILFPIFSYILNGFMYLDGKCFIPMIPLILLVVAEYINRVVNSQIDYKKLIKYLLVISLILIIFSLHLGTKYILIIDIIISIILLLLSSKINNKYLIFIPTIIITFISFIFSANNETYFSKDLYNEINNDAYYELSKINDNNIYRISHPDYYLYTPNKVYNISNLNNTMYSSASNKYYYNFIRNIFQNEISYHANSAFTESNNVLFNIYSGTKYLVTKNEPLIGYEKIRTIDNISLYQNKDVLPLIYASNKMMSLREFENLEYPYIIDALLNYVIVDEEIGNVYNSNIIKYNDGYNIDKFNNISLKEENGHYLIKADNNASLKLNLNKEINGEILIIIFKMNKEKEGYACSSNITINGITNALSCNTWRYHNHNNIFKYVISSNKNINSLDITFTKGEFDISNIELYTTSYDKVKDIHNNIDSFNVSNNKISNIIEGTINVKNDGYVKTSIPYEDKAFKVYIDNKEVNTKLVDESFLGFKINKGKHTIKIVYHSPYLKEGKIISLIGLTLLFITYLYSKKKHA